MRLMAGLVAATGQVTGIDRDDRLGQEALHVLRDAVPGRFAFAHADVETADAVSRRVKKGPGRRPLSAKRQRFVELRERGVEHQPHR